jgi:SAM-dependent methyltransferase
MFQPAAIEPAVELLAELAGDGAALELGIGTGRLAVPLHARGVPVSGIDLSPEMVARLRAKRGTEDIRVTIGDFSTARVEGTFRVAYLVYNTINNVTTQDGQVACFQNAASHLEPGGSFVVEVGVPGLQRLHPGERYIPFTVSDDYLGFDDYHDLVHQRFSSNHYRIADGRVDAISVPFRYVWPSELDLMARIAGMRLLERWSSWNREPFTADSRRHVSVWEKT